MPLNVIAVELLQVHFTRKLTIGMLPLRVVAI